MFQVKIFICKSFSIDAKAASTVSLQTKAVSFKWLKLRKLVTYIQKVSSLNHKVLNYSVECSPLETGRNSVSFEFTSAKLSKILGGLRNNISEQLNDDAANVLKTNMLILITK